MDHVFVSYSRKDSEFVDQLIRDLENNGIDFWLDRQDISGGDRWRPAIVEAIRACQSFLLVLSPNSVASENVSKELSIADTHNRRIIPIAYQPCDIPAQMEYQLSGLQWIDFSANTYEMALGRLTQVLSKASVSSPSPKPALSFQPTSDQQAQSNSVGSSNRLRLIAMIGGAVILLGVLAFIFLKPGNSDEGANLNPTPTTSSSLQSSSPQVYNRLEAVRRTAEGVNALNDENQSRESAILFFNEAIKTDPTYAEEYFYRGQAFVALKKPDRAIADFKKALELELEADQRKTTEDFLAGLQKPATDSGNNGNNGQPTGTNPPPPSSSSTPGSKGIVRFPTIATSVQTVPKVVIQSQVADLFNQNKGARIQATTKLIIEQKQNPEAVSLAISSAQTQLNNPAGVINTLVYLESVPPAVLSSKRKEVVDFLDAVRRTNPGPQTQEHLNKVAEALKGS